MNIATKIIKSRENLTTILDEVDFDTSTIQKLSEVEIKKMLDKTVDLSEISALASGCCHFTVKHKILDSFKLNIFYVSLDPESSRLTKSFSNKVINLYLNNVVEKNSSCLLILNEKITETIQKIMDDINIKLNSSREDISQLQSEMKSKKYLVNTNYFRRCWLLNLDHITVNLKKHRLVSPHKPIKDENEIKKILEKCNCKKLNLPVISRHDIMSNYTLASPGDIMVIQRTSKTTGDYPFYRLVK